MKSRPGTAHLLFTSCGGNFIESVNTLGRAADLGEQAGAVEDAGRALLSLMEEHADRITGHELPEAYERAHNLLKETQDAETILRLRACALRLVSNGRASLSERRVRSLVDFGANFNLDEWVHTYEARYVRRALIDGGGQRHARLAPARFALPWHVRQGKVITEPSTLSRAGGVIFM